MEFEDDLSKDIAAAVDATAPEPPANKPGVAPPPEASPGSPSPVESASEGERQRDDKGRFAPKAEDAPKPADAKVVPVVAPKPGEAPTQPAASAAAPPAHWKGNGKVEWNRLPQHVQQAISEDYANVTKTQGELQQLRSAIGDERAQALSASYGSVGQGLQNLFAISDMATKNPQGFVLWFAQQRGIDLTQLVGQGQGQGDQPAQPPHPLEREVSQLRSQLQQMMQQQTQGQMTQHQSEIERFAADAAHPYFNDVRTDMAGLMQTGSAKTLQDAYDKAVWARSEIRTSLLEQEHQKRIDANAAKVANASQRAVSITGSPAGRNVAADEPTRSLDDDIRHAVDSVLN